MDERCENTRISSTHAVSVLFAAVIEVVRARRDLMCQTRFIQQKGDQSLHVLQPDLHQPIAEHPFVAAIWVEPCLQQSVKGHQLEQLQTAK